MERLYGNRNYKFRYGETSENDEGDRNNWIDMLIWDASKNRELERYKLKYAINKEGNIVINSIKSLIGKSVIEDVNFRFSFVFPLVELLNKSGENKNIFCNTHNSHRLLKALEPFIKRTSRGLMINEQKVETVVEMIGVLEKSPVVREIEEIGFTIKFKTKAREIFLAWGRKSKSEYISSNIRFGLLDVTQSYYKSNHIGYMDTAESLEKILTRLELEEIFMPALLKE